MKTLICICTLLLAAPAWATNLAFSEASLDWSGLSYTISEGLTVTAVGAGEPSAGSYASTGRGAFTGLQGDGVSASSYTLLDRKASASASAFNGLLISSSMAGTTPLIPDLFAHGEAAATAGTNFWLYGSGYGTLTVSIPYALRIGLSETHPFSVNPSQYEVTLAYANAYLGIGPGVIDGGSMRQFLEWDNTFSQLNGTLTTTGLLTASRTFDNPYWGPLTSLYAGVQTSATAYTVPEPSTLLLLLAAGMACVIGLLGRLWVRDWWACAHQHYGEDGRKLVH